MKACWCALIVALGGCSRESSVVVQPDPDRRWMNVAFDTAWIIGGSAADTILGYPARLTTLGDLVILTDPGHHQVTALRVKDGTLAWTNGAEEGHAFRRPLIMWSRPDHRIGVVDEDTQILTTIDSGGRTVSDLNLVESRFINGGCALKGKGTLVTSVDEMGPLYSLGTDARTATPVPMTVLGARGRSPIILQPFLENNHDWTSCVVATAFGGGLALWNGSAFTRHARYRESMPTPAPAIGKHNRMTDSGMREDSFPMVPRGAPSSALDVATVPGRIRVLFAGTSANHGRIIDDYDDQTLEYLGSTLLPSRVGEFAAPVPDLVVVLGKQRGFPIVVALRQRSVSP